MNDTIYLGDAVYAHFDGYVIDLRLNDHRNERAVYATKSGTAFRNSLQRQPIRPI
jgi:hypothetical protein